MFCGDIISECIAQDDNNHAMQRDISSFKIGWFRSPISCSWFLFCKIEQKELKSNARGMAATMRCLSVRLLKNAAIHEHTSSKKFEFWLEGYLFYLRLLVLLLLLILLLCWYIIFVRCCLIDYSLSHRSTKSMCSCFHYF